MATKNYVPRADGEGQIGTSLKRWLKGVFINLLVSGSITDGSNITSASEIKETKYTAETSDVIGDEIDLCNLDGADSNASNISKLQEFQTEHTEEFTNYKNEQELFQDELDINNIIGV